MSFLFHFLQKQEYFRLDLLVQIFKATVRCCQQLLNKFIFTWCRFKKNWSINEYYLNWTFIVLWKIKQHTCFGGHITSSSPSPRTCEGGHVHGQVIALFVYPNQIIWVTITQKNETWYCFKEGKIIAIVFALNFAIKCFFNPLQKLKRLFQMQQKTWKKEWNGKEGEGHP